MKHVDAAIEELEAEIRNLTEAHSALLRLRGKTTPEAATPAKPARRPSAKRAAPARKPRAPKPDQTADADGVSETGAKVLRALKDQPLEVAAIASKTKLRPNVVAIGLRKLVRDGLAEDNDGFFRLTDKGHDAALE
jgi:predicted Rossmann fold nucleotide-binding protein DprA/Smf involved in DNA uptake